MSKNLSGKYSQKFLDHDKQSATDAFKTSSKRAIEKTAEVISDLIDNKLVITNENGNEISKEIHKEIYIYIYIYIYI